MVSKLPYFLLLAALLGLNGAIFFTAYLASEGSPAAQDLYAAFAPSCHQLTTRSLCLYKYDADGHFGIGDCLPMSTFSLSRANEVYYPEKVAYKLPVCSRDVAIYFSMLIGLLALPRLQRIESQKWPNRFILVAAAIPIGIDGVGQLLGLWESTNTVRVATGALIGIVLPFYLLPILNTLCSSVLEKIFPAKTPAFARKPKPNAHFPRPAGRIAAKKKRAAQKKAKRGKPAALKKAKRKN